MSQRGHGVWREEKSFRTMHSRKDFSSAPSPQPVPQVRNDILFLLLNLSRQAPGANRHSTLTGKDNHNAPVVSGFFGQYALWLCLIRIRQCPGQSAYDARQQA